MWKLGDHATNCRSIFQRATAVHFVKTQTDQRCALFGWTTDWASDLLDRNRLALLLSHHSNPLSMAYPVAT
ncbi:conserved hypothetical protein [Brucella sp. NVSL 07-0026]|nr:conserved hypothetical protein [Brucella sp. NVSL 07-0026]